VQVARELRVSTKSVYQWRRCWRSGGEAALASRGPGGAVCRLSPAQLAKLRAALDGGSAAWGWSEDQRWTLGRVTMLIGRLFHVRYTLRGTSYSACGLARGAACSTGCASTAGARASAGPCPKPATPA
jgi:transposase